MELATTEQDQSPTRQALAIEGRSGRLKVTGKLKAALDAMVWEGLKRDDAAAKANLSVHGLYAALRKPHVRQYYTQQIEVLRDSERARSVFRLTELRDQDDNKMVAFNAARELAGGSDDGKAGLSGATHSAGITIRILNIAPQQATQVNVTQGELTRD